MLKKQIVIRKSAKRELNFQQHIGRGCLRQHILIIVKNSIKDSS